MFLLPDRQKTLQLTGRRQKVHNACSPLPAQSSTRTATTVASLATPTVRPIAVDATCVPWPSQSAAELELLTKSVLRISLLVKRFDMGALELQLLADLQSAARQDGCKSDKGTKETFQLNVRRHVHVQIMQGGRHSLTRSCNGDLPTASQL